MKIKIESDVYNISKRIKVIDKDYYVVFNTLTKKFEIHNSSQLGSTYCLTLPYSELDKRTLDYIHKTKSSNLDYILEKIDNDNKLLKSAETTCALKNVYERMEETK